MTDLIRANRRQVLGGALAGAAAAIPGGARAAGAIFAHGVASGDPLDSAVIIWTRVSGVSRSTSVRWTVARDAAFTQVVKAGTALATGAKDYTVKVDVRGLRPGTTHHYRFEAAGAVSPAGRTKTLPTGDVARLRFAMFSCSDFASGFWNAYREAARIDDLDAVLHLGDYIYEYADTLQLPAQRLGLVPVPRSGQARPPREIVTLADYRARHAQYKTDPDLQELHRKNPWITVWDDHETTNDGWTGGAENHQPDEGDWDARKSRAIQAYYEWMPIREPSERPRIDGEGDPQGLYRDFDFGGLARLIMLDTRLAGRDEQLDPAALIGTYAGARQDTLDGTAATRARRLLGPAQEAFLASRVRLSTQTWQLIGNQVLAFYQPIPDILGTAVLPQPLKDALIGALRQGFPNIDELLALAAFGLPSPLAADAWTGYRTARAELLGTLAQARNPVVFTGDSHNAWTANLRAPFAGGTAPIAAEFGGTSVTSGGFEQFLPGFPPEAFAALLVDTSARRSPTDKLIFTEQRRRGFLDVTVTPAATRVEQVFLSTVFARDYTVERVPFTVAAGAKAAVAG